MLRVTTSAVSAFPGDHVLSSLSVGNPLSLRQKRESELYDCLCIVIRRSLLLRQALSHESQFRQTIVDKTRADTAFL